MTTEQPNDQPQDHPSEMTMRDLNAEIQTARVAQRDGARIDSDRLDAMERELYHRQKAAAEERKAAREAEAAQRPPRATRNQMAYIAELAARDFGGALPLMQAAHDAAGGKGGTLTKNSGIKWLGYAISQEQASTLIDDLVERIGR